MDTLEFIGTLLFLILLVASSIAFGVIGTSLIYEKDIKELQDEIKQLKYDQSFKMVSLKGDK